MPFDYQTQYQIHTEPVPQAPESVTEDRWHQPWSEPPVKAKQGLGAANQDFFAFFPTPLVSFGWFEELSKPQSLIRPGLSAGDQQFIALEPFPHVSFGWFEGLSEPVRFRAFLAALQRFIELDPLPRVSFGWFEGLSEPVRVKLGLPASEQQFLAIDTAVIPTSRLTEWFAWLSEPVRIKPGLLAALQQFYAAPSQLRPNPTTFAILNALETKDTMLAGARVFNAIDSGEVGIYEAKSPPGEIGVNVPTVIRASVAITIL